MEMSFTLDSNQKVYQTTLRYRLRDGKFWMVIAALGFGSILSFSNLYFVQPLLPFFVEAFAITPTTASLTLSLSVLAMIMGLLVFGFLSDRKGRVKIIKITMLFSILPLPLYPLVHDFFIINVLRIVQGFFIAGLPAAAIAYIGEEVERRSVGIAVAVYIACNAIGGMGGRVLVGMVADRTTWQTSLYVLTGVSVVLLALLVILLPASNHFKASNLSIKEDIAGMFVHLKDSQLIPAFVMGIVLQISFTALWTYLPFHLSEAPYSLSMKAISLTYLAYSLGVIGSPIAGKFAERFEHPSIISVGVILSMTGFLFTVSRDVMLFVIGLCIICLGFFIVHSMTAAYVSLNAKHHKGGASSLYLVSYYIGVAAGGTIGGFIWESFAWNGIIFLSFLLLPVMYWMKRK